MLVKKREDWEFYYEENPSTSVSQKTAKAPRLRTGMRAKLIGTMLLLAVMAMIITIRSEAMVTAGYALVQTKTQVTLLEKENEALQLDNAKLKSPQRIQNIASRELGMVLPNNVYVAAKKESNLQSTETAKKSYAQLVQQIR